MSVPTVPGLPAPVQDAVGSAQQTVNNTTGNAPVVGKQGGGSTSTPSSTQGTGSAGGNSTGSTPAAGGGSAQATGPSSSTSSSRRAGSSPSRAAARRRAARRRAAARRSAAGAAATRKTARAGGGQPAKPAKSESGSPVARVINRIERVIPGPVKVLIAVLALVALGMALRARVMGARARRLARHREELLGDVGLLQRALLPDVPSDLRGIDVSVAYRPAEGPAAGGDFYDVFELDGGRTAIIVGDVCGHGRAALAVTALMRYTLRAYLGVGFEPRIALQIAARALDGDPEGALTTVVLAIYDPATGALTYACAGHESPIILGGVPFEPVTAFSSPPLGGFMDTGHRQTTVALPPGASACFFTDGLVEARLGNDMVGRERLTDIVGELEPDAGAQLLLERLAQSADRAPDDMAACLVRAQTGAARGPSERVEELELDAQDLAGDRVEEFLRACGVEREEAGAAIRAASAKAAEFGGVLLRVTMSGAERSVEVSPREAASLPVPSLDAARRQAALQVPTA